VSAAFDSDRSDEEGVDGEGGGGEVEGVVQILKVREGCVTGRFTYLVSVPVVQGLEASGTSFSKVISLLNLPYKRTA